MSAPTANGSQDYRLPPQEPEHKKYPDLSARHADWAISGLIAAANTQDSREAEAKLDAANTYAILSLRDKVDELTSVFKDIRDLMAERREP